MLRNNTIFKPLQYITVSRSTIVALQVEIQQDTDSSHSGDMADMCSNEQCILTTGTLKVLFS
jgi:hypothetical protein